MTLSSIALVICMCEVRVSGVASMSFRNDGSPHDTNPSGAFLRMIFRFFFGSSPALRIAARFSVSCSGAWATTVPAVS